jgi:N-acetylglutamate synthase-like GNAT family acetyltransferase
MGNGRQTTGKPGPRKDSVTIRPFGSGDEQQVVRRHGELYADEYGWDQDFRRHVSGIVSEFLLSTHSDRTQAWVAEANGRFAGCVFVTEHSSTCAQLRLLLVEPWARRQGLGARLVNQCISFAREAGYQQIRLWTNSVLLPARRLYERFGFRRISQQSHHSYGCALVGETWLLELQEGSAERDGLER